MKTQFAGLACAALSTTAMAQTSGVTLYGVADANLEYTTNNPAAGSSSGHSKLAVSSGGMSPSRFGMRGIEDVGNGMKATFALEGNLSIDNGVGDPSGRLFGRQAWVALGNGSQRVMLGRQYTSMFLMMANYSPTAYATQYEPVLAMGGPVREDNMVKYHAEFGPLTAEAHYSFGEQAGSMAVNNGFGAGADYRMGNFGVALAYDNKNSAADAAGNYTRGQKASAGVLWNVGPGLLFQVAYRYGKNTATTPGTVARDDLFWAGVNWQATPALALTGAFYYDRIRGIVPGSAAAASIDALGNPWQATFIGDYTLSKRTDLYLSAAYSKHSALNLDSFNGAAAVYTLGPGERDQIGVALGIRHKF